MTSALITFDDKSVTVAELEALLDAMDDAPMRFPAGAVFHRSLRTPEKEQAAPRQHDFSDRPRIPSELVGFLRIVTDRAYFYYLCDVMVHPGWQRRGIGRQLVDESPCGRAGRAAT